MPTYVETCNCRGSRPSGVIGQKHISRPDVVGMLLHDRYLPRYLIAPVGFGKSTVVFEYAHIIFAFEHVFWMKCTSPCFLRDIDADSMFDQITRCDASIRLIVFEDVPLLDDIRAQKFNDLVNELLELQCEVIVTCTPSVDTFSSLQRTKIVISSSDLLLSDDEMAFEEARGEIRKGWEEEIAISERIPCLIWTDDGEKTILGGLKDECLAPEFKLTAFLFFVLHSGNLDDLEMFLPKSKCKEALDYLASFYPYVGIDLLHNSYKTCAVEIGNIANAFEPAINSMCQSSVFESPDILFENLADRLIAREKYSRASAFILSLANPQTCANWIGRNGWRLIGSNHILEAFSLAETISRDINNHAIGSMQAWCLFLLDDIEASRTKAIGLSKRESSDILLKMIAHVTMFLCSNKQTGQEILHSLQDDLNELETTLLNKINAKSLAHEHIIDWFVIVNYLVKLGVGIEDAIDFWLDKFDESSRNNKTNNALIISGSWILEMLNTCITPEVKKTINCANYLWIIEQWENFDSTWVKDNFIQGDKNNPYMHFFDKYKSLLESQDDHNEWLILCGGYAFENTISAYGLKETIELNLSLKSKLRIEEVKYFEQKENYRKQKSSNSAKKAIYHETNPNLLITIDKESKKHKPSTTSIPTLEINLFGGFGAHIGDEPVNPKLLSRRKVRAVLALLVINRGREVSRDQIAKAIWPDHDYTYRKRNFYSLWSLLKKALDFKGTCPYLIRTQDGCRIDVRYVSSDVYRFDDLCKTLMFGVQDLMSWEELFSQVNEDFSEDLMPGEDDNELIAAFREKYRDSLVDGLISTASRLNSANETRGALWFAREAHRRNNKREDASIALMEAQIASEQRGAALETYFECRKYLSEELGIDPSARLVELYRSIIETEQIF